MSSSIPTLKLEEINRNDSVLVDGQSQSDGPEDLRKVLTHFSALLVDQKELRVHQDVVVDDQVLNQITKRLGIEVADLAQLTGRPAMTGEDGLSVNKYGVVAINFLEFQRWN